MKEDLTSIPVEKRPETKTAQQPKPLSVDALVLGKQIIPGRYGGGVSCVLTKELTPGTFDEMQKRLSGFRRNDEAARYNNPEKGKATICSISDDRVTAASVEYAERGDTLHLILPQRSENYPQMRDALDPSLKGIVRVRNRVLDK